MKKNIFTPIFVGIILTLFFCLQLFAARQDSLTIDELAHLPAGISYITQLDYRLNPEHPPLQKVLAGLSARIFAHPTVPTESEAWTKGVNDQWAFGKSLLFRDNSNTDQIIFWGRIPSIFLSLFFGWLIYWYLSRHYSQRAGLIALLFYAFSPTILGHSHYVTFDVGAGLGFFVALISFVAYLKKPDWREAIWAGFGLSLALLLKFSALILIPIYLILLVAYSWQKNSRPSQLWARAITVLIIPLLMIWTTYGILTVHYPTDRNYADAASMTGNVGLRGLVPARMLMLSLLKHRATQPLGHYLLGAVLTSNRAGSGNTTYFMGSISNRGSHWYFPVLYATKEALAFHILTLFAAITTLMAIWKNRYGVREWFSSHQLETALGLTVGLYWLTAVVSPLNIGLRHVLPTFPLIYILVALGIEDWLPYHQSPWQRIIPIGLGAWLIIAPLTATPYWLSYYNELVGRAHGSTIAVDSNFDWGQDLKRLNGYIDRQGIKKIAVDYYGSDDPAYRLGSAFVPWWSANGKPTGWFAVSASTLTNATHSTDIQEADRYSWLKDEKPVAKIGNTISVYYFGEEQ